MPGASSSSPRDGSEGDAVGLTSTEAEARLRQDGPNILPSARPRSAIDLAVAVLREPMIALLVATAVLYVVLGEPAEAVAMTGAVLVVVGISFVQERRTERTLYALRSLASPRALVVRDGRMQRIVGTAIVRGDLVRLAQGDRIPADASLSWTAGLTVDESMLTGESVPVVRGAGDIVYSGTLVVAGHGTAEVTATGARTALGAIGRSLADVPLMATPLQREVRRVVRLLAVMGLTACAVVTVVYGAVQGLWQQGVLAGLTMAISMVPEEFPVILTVFLALGAWRLSQHRVLTRRFPAIETLGAATVLCVDKTGTLTLNRMTLAGVDAGTGFERVDAARAVPSEAVRRVLQDGFLASEPRAVDPVDLAFVHAYAAMAGERPGGPQPALAREYPLTDVLLAAANGWVMPGHERLIAVKGAPEAIVLLCRMPDPARTAFLARVETLAHQGLRVLAVARAPVAHDFPDSLTALAFEEAALVAFEDPVRPGVPDAVAECRSAGIRVLMLTGDYPQTALAVARAIDLDTSAGTLTGSEVAGMSDEALIDAARRVNVFSRVVPDQKLRLVRVLQATGEVVAMTGDGVNDAPALKAAEIGIAMGQRGTDVAREAGALVLLDDDFTSIVGAVRLGRRIYDNIRKASGYVLAIHLPIAGMSLLPPLLHWPLVLMPLHVIFMELIVDPACSVAFEMEPEEGDVMARPPRRPDVHLFDRVLVWRSLLQGAGMLAVAFGIYAGAVRLGLADDDVRMITFATLIVTNLALILANRSLTRAFVSDWRSVNPAIWWVVAGALGALGAVLFVPALRDLFRLARPHPIDLVVCALASVAALAWMEFLKRPASWRTP